MDSNFVKPYGGCKRNATSEASKTANTRKTSSSNCQRRLRQGISESTSMVALKNTKITLTTSLKLFTFIMTLNMIVQNQKIKAVAATTVATIDANENTTEFEEPRKLTQYERNIQEICASDIKWNNSCGGTHVANISTESQRIPHHVILSTLKRKISTQYNQLKANAFEIDVSDARRWKNHSKFYEFLPDIKANPTHKKNPRKSTGRRKPKTCSRRKYKLALRRWHLYAQKYVGSFTYLRHAQLFYELHYNAESNTTRELKKYQEAALEILCAIETAINITSPSNRQSKRRLHFIKPNKMRNTLKFKTLLPDDLCTVATSGVSEPLYVNSLDLKFAALRFRRFLRKMRRIIKCKIKARTSISMSSSISRHSGSGSSAIDSSHSLSKRADASHASRIRGGVSDYSYSDSVSSFEIKLRPKTENVEGNHRKHHIQIRI